MLEDMCRNSPSHSDNLYTCDMPVHKTGAGGGNLTLKYTLVHGLIGSLSV